MFLDKIIIAFVLCAVEARRQRRAQTYRRLHMCSWYTSDSLCGNFDAGRSPLPPATDTHRLADGRSSTDWYTAYDPGTHPRFVP